jgi:hypothetical protein
VPLRLRKNHLATMLRGCIAKSIGPQAVNDLLHGGMASVTVIVEGGVRTVEEFALTFLDSRDTDGGHGPNVRNPTEWLALSFNAEVLLQCLP